MRVSARAKEKSLLRAILLQKIVEFALAHPAILRRRLYRVHLGQSRVDVVRNVFGGGEGGERVRVGGAVVLLDPGFRRPLDDQDVFAAGSSAFATREEESDLI